MYICLDIETTGLNPKKDHVIEIAAIRFDHTGILDKWTSLVKPPIAIPEFTQRLTGINDEMVKDAPKLEEVLDELKSFLGTLPIMGHFIPFDVGFLNEHGANLLPERLLDTCQLAQAFLPNEASYSLEVLAKKMSILQVDAHRAEDDVKANIDLFFNLANHVRSLSKQEKNAITPLLEKSNWAWANIVLSILPEEGGQRIEEDAHTHQAHNERHANLSDLTASLKAPFLFEEVSHTTQDILDHALALKGSSLLVVPELHFVPENEEVGTLEHPNFYLDEERLEQFLAKTPLNEAETLLGIKIQIWRTHTVLGKKSELRLVKEEKKYWFDICCQETEPVSFYKKAWESAQEKRILVVGHQHFLKDRAKKDPLLPLRDHTVIEQIENMIDSLQYAWRITLSESRFLEDLRRLKEENPDRAEVLTEVAARISILFGFLGMTLQKYGEAYNEKHTLTVEAHHRNTAEWNNVKKAAASIAADVAALGSELKTSALRDELERYLHYLAKILQEDGDTSAAAGNTLWMTTSMDGLPMVHAFPQSTSALFEERVWKHSPVLHAFAHHADLNDGLAFLKTQLNLPKDLQIQKHEGVMALPLHMPIGTISSPNDPKNIKEVVHELRHWIPEVKGNVFLLVSAKNTAESFFYGSKSLLTETDRKLFVQNMSGGLGKISKMAEESDGKNFFIGDSGLLYWLLEEGISLDFLALHRLPFSPPSDPIQNTLAAKVQNAYQNFTVPSMQLKLHRIFHAFLGEHWENKKILMLDSRY